VDEAVAGNGHLQTFRNNSALGRHLGQGCQMVSFQTQNPNLGKFWRALDWKMLIYFMAIWIILQTFGIFYNHLVHFLFIWYILAVLVSWTKKNLANNDNNKIRS
jgi:hypothetical protein